jgi:hypothetical protein
MLTSQSFRYIKLGSGQEKKNVYRFVKNKHFEITGSKELDASKFSFIELCLKLCHLPRDSLHLSASSFVSLR